MQEENANEWALREQCESEICSIKRELRQAEITIKVNTNIQTRVVRKERNQPVLLYRPFIKIN